LLRAASSHIFAHFRRIIRQVAVGGCVVVVLAGNASVGQHHEDLTKLLLRQESHGCTQEKGVAEYQWLLPLPSKRRSS